jgi:multidrug efflux system membrane fusion protein
MDDQHSNPLPTFPRPGNAPQKRHVIWPWILVLGVIVLGVIGYITHRQTADAAAAAGGGSRRGGGGAAGGLLMVTPAAAHTGDIGVYINALGIVTPLNTVSVLSRVTGQIVKVNYTEGQMVHAGDSLLEIDPAPFQAAVDQADGQLARDQALLENARLDLERYKEAYASNAIPKQQYDTQVATVDQDEGTVKLDQGNLDNAKVQLAYCHIAAPITGRVGLRLVDAGNVVQAGGTTPLVVITQLQPITVIFNVAEDYLPQIQKPLRAGKTLAADAFDRTQQEKIASGTLETLDNQIDTATGTLKLRALFTNEDETLFPNQFVNIRLQVDMHSNVLLLPNSAIQRNDTGAYVYLLSANQPEATNPMVPVPTAAAGTNRPAGQPATAAMQTITVGVTDGDISEVQGLDEGAQVAGDNFNRLTDGAKVIIRPAGSGAGGGTNSVAGGKGAKSGHRKKSSDQSTNQWSNPPGQKPADQ